MQLARLHGVLPVYRANDGRVHCVGTETLERLLAALGVDAADPVTAARERRRAIWREIVPPVVVSWLPGVVRLQLRLPAGRAAEAGIEVSLEGGGQVAVTVRTDRLPVDAERSVDGERWIRATAELRRGLPAGYHRARVTVGDAQRSFLWIAAPRTAHLGEGGTCALFVPLYALHSSRRRDCGDLTDWLRLSEWAGGIGIGLMGSLPLCAAFLDEPVEPSPYAPVSRTFWNEAYIDVDRLPELSSCRSARVLADESRAEPADPELVDWTAVAMRRRKILADCADRYFAGRDRRAIEQFVRERPEAERFARFRAAQQRYGRNWRDWPAALREGEVDTGDVDEKVFRRHLYAQWRVQQQLGEALETMRGHGTELYLDLPLGVHPDGFDSWAHRDEFLTGCSAGAPPDPFFTRGQDWGFAPLDPRASRAAGHRYFRKSLHHQLQHCGALRIDHVMGLHRIWCVPHGIAADRGAYLRQPADELFAILTLESRRARCALVGEDLGTVPVATRRALAEHGVLSMHVVQFEIDELHSMRALHPRGAKLAALNTHDMPTFAAFWTGADVAGRVAMGLMEEHEAREERERRTRIAEAVRRDLGIGSGAADDTERALLGILGTLARSDAEVLVVGLEDLLGETLPQNVPGTGPENPNWRRRTRLTLDEMLGSAELRRRIERLVEAREEDPSMTARKKPSPSKPQPTARGGKPAAAPTPPRPDATPDVGGPTGGVPRDRPWSLLGELDLHLFNEGRHDRMYCKLGAHPIEQGGQQGTYFAVWAPNAREVSVIGDFNHWNRDETKLSSRDVSGIWEGFVPEAQPGMRYKFHIRSRLGDYQVDKADPYALMAETPPATASVIWKSTYQWNDREWMATRKGRNALDAPISTYELHVGSWRHRDGRPLSYREMAEPLCEHMRRTGFTHVELMPVMEHPFHGSWGYQVTGYFAPTSRYGNPDDLRYLIDQLHQAGVGVIFDWVPSHFPSDEHGLVFFDGTHLYEHADPRKGYHPDWKSMIFDYGRHEVLCFLLSSARFWLSEFHADGLRVDAVASMLYLDYSRREGEWIPNEQGGRENLQAVAFMRRMNEIVYADFPDVQTIAEESTAWPMVSRPTSMGGLGFGMKWDMGWMHDTLRYFKVDPVHRRYHHGDLTFRSLYAWNENFVLSLSHDEVVHGKGSLLTKMPGDDWQRFANLRLLYAEMFATPGKKLLFMGSELAPWREWNHDAELEWFLDRHETHGGVQRLIGDLNRVYRDYPAMHVLDCEQSGFEWVDVESAEHSVLVTLRKGRKPHEMMIVAMNFTPVPRHNYQVGAPADGVWREVLNTDATVYGGSGHGNLGALQASPVPFRWRPFSLNLTLPPLGAVFLAYEGAQGGVAPQGKVGKQP